MNRFFQLMFLVTLCIACQQNESFAQAKVTTAQEAKSNVKKVELSVSGMTCQRGCADGIDKKLNMTYGVVRSKTNFEKEKSIVTFDPAVITVEQIIKVIEDKGYEAKVVKGPK